MKLFRDVDQWFSADDRDSCFWFINTCQILDLEPTYIRTGLKMWRERLSNDSARYVHFGVRGGSPSVSCQSVRAAIVSSLRLEFRVYKNQSLDAQPKPLILAN